MAKRRKTGQRTARENVEDLVDPGSFIEYGGLGLAAQRQRYSLEDLIKNSPADGIITGVGTVNRDTFGGEGARVMVLAYDYERGKAISMASYLEIDGVIDPADTRDWILRGLRSTGPLEPRRPFIDTW